jgi:hypothetical protein
MRKGLLLAVLTSLCFGIPVWGNGDNIQEPTVDPRTGMVYPIRKTRAQVLHQKLTIRFVTDGAESDFTEEDPTPGEWSIRRAEVETEYTIYNPQDQPEHLKIAFAAAGNVMFTRAPVLFDGHPIDWKYLNEYQVLRLHLPVMLRSFEGLLKEKPQLREHLERAYQLYRQKKAGGGSKAYRAAEEYVFKHATDISNTWRHTALSVYMRYREGKPPTYISELANLLAGLNRTEALPWTRWDAHQRYLHPVSGALLGLKEVEGEWSRTTGVVAEAVSLLQFEVMLQPRSQHRLTVRYAQEPAYQRRMEGASTVVGGRHLMYLLRTQSWASYGPIDVEITVPKGLRLRAMPAVPLAGERDNDSVYKARIVQPEGNLYMVVGRPDIFREAVLKVKNAAGRELLVRWNGDFFVLPLVGGTPRLPARSLLQALEHVPADERLLSPARTQKYQCPLRWNAGRVELSQGSKKLQLWVNTTKAVLNGQTLRLLKPPLLLDGAVWLDVRDYLFLYCRLRSKNDFSVDVRGRSIPLKSSPASPHAFRMNWNSRLAIATIRLPE